MSARRADAPEVVIRAAASADLPALAARGAPPAVLMTAERNAAAQRLFARAGFRPTMVEMTRELDGRAELGEART